MLTIKVWKRFGTELRFTTAASVAAGRCLQMSGAIPSLSVTQGGDSALDDQNLGSMRADSAADSEYPES